MLSAHPVSASVSHGDSQGCVEDPPNAVQCSVEETSVQGTVNKDIEIDKDVVDGSNQASAGAEPDASAKVDGTDLPPSLPEKPLSGKGLRDRLNKAIVKAIAVSKSKCPPSGTENATDARRYIDISINYGPWQVVPWMACHSWPVMEVFLKEWFSDDQKSLDEFSDGAYELQMSNSIIHPETWEHVLVHGSGVRCVLDSCPAPPPPAPYLPYPGDRSLKDDPQNPDKSLQGDAENHEIRYTVNFYQREMFGDGKEFVRETRHNEPVEFVFGATSDAKGNVVLEEMSDVVSPRGAHKVHAKTEHESGKKIQLGRRDRVSGTSLMIHSPYLLNVLRSVVEYSAEAPDADDESFTAGLFEYPYKDLFHHMHELENYRIDAKGLRAKHKPEYNEKCDEHIALLVAYLESLPNVSLKAAKVQWAREIPVTTFAAAWLLFKPGEDVYVREDDGSLNAYVVDKVNGGFRENNGARVPGHPRPYTITVWNLVFDGKTIYRRLRTVEVNVFDNEQKITALPLVPVKFIDETDRGVLRKRLINRGRKYHEYSKRPCFLQYTGKGLKHGTYVYKRTRVVVEHASLPWLREGFSPQMHILPRDGYTIGESIRVPHCECNDCRATANQQAIRSQAKFSEYDRIDPKADKELSAHEYLIMSSHMYAFVLKDRTYDLLDVDGLEEPMMVEDAIDRLVMDNSHKGMVKAIAKTYTDSTQSGRFSADFIHGKGEGQVILLHGPPGTGKTLTAESVAEYTRRPLLSITAADLGHEPDAVEKSLLGYFRRATDWDAIVLLDEADVYLEQRSISDLKRNSIVSVFLRALDYFQGILFLTTNRVGHFDEAFMSRIHLSLGYDKLDHSARDKIWDNLFRKLKENHHNEGPEINYDYDAKRYVKTPEVMNLEWNGREIRNAFQTAVALAIFDSKQKSNSGPPEVTEDHLKQVVSMSTAFRKYITATHEGLSHSDLAYKHGIREDRVPSTPAK